MGRDGNGKFSKSAITVDRVCDNCGITFQIRKSRLKYGGGKCCSRKCVDENKKKTYKGKNNPMYGVIPSKETLEKKSKIAKKLWQDTEFVEKQNEAREKFLKRAATDGTWDLAVKKREQTFIEKIGKRHNWVGKYGERKCDKTTIKKLGMSSIEYASLSNKNNKNTSIEIKVQKILSKNNIDFIKHWKLDGYEYDLYLPNLNILIECDGDYWHGRGLCVSELNEAQKNTRKNDRLKDDIANKNNIKLLRFWGGDIRSDKFENMLLENI